MSRRPTEPSKFCNCTYCSNARRIAAGRVAQPTQEVKKMAKTITLTDEKVRAMAASCSDAARVLRAGIPEAFEKQVNLSNLLNGSYDGPGGSYQYKLAISPTAVKKAFDLNSNPADLLIQPAGKEFQLSRQFIWTMKTVRGVQYLVATPQID